MDIATYKDFFANKRITLMGLGLLGRGVGDAAFLAPLCKELVVTDRKSAEELAPSLEQLKAFNNIRYVLGEHTTEDFTDTDMVIKAAGVPLDSPYIDAAKQAGVPVYMSTALFAKFASKAGATIVGVTGTRGKSTVTHMVYHALVQAGRRAHLGGNVRGLSTLAMLPAIESGDIVVLELDSWQLQGFGDLQISPEVAVFTNLKQDHLNYYPNEEAYFEDKANIFKYQKKDNVLVVGSQVAGMWIQTHYPDIKPIVPVVGQWRLNVLGEHNKENASLAAGALRALRLSEDEIKNGLESFEPVEGRLQLIGEFGGIKVYNDNNATTPDATIAALAALAPEKPVLIAGGTDKTLDVIMLANMAPELVRGVVLLKGTGTNKLKPILVPLLEQKQIPWIECDSMDEAVKIAFGFAQGNGAILMSPGFASFGMFANEYERNDAFIAAVKAL